MEIHFMDDCSEEQVNNVVRVSWVTLMAVRNGKFVFVKRRSTGTLELPRLGSEDNEKPSKTVRRLLGDVLGAVSYSVKFSGVYSVTSDTDVDYGILYFADIESMGPFPRSDEYSGCYFLSDPPEDSDKWSFFVTDKPLFEKAFNDNKHMLTREE